VLPVLAVFLSIIKHELREILIAATEAERVGEEWIAHVSEQHRKTLDREALMEHFGAEALQPFWRETAWLRCCSSSFRFPHDERR
jgi:hypothetical protein